MEIASKIIIGKIYTGDNQDSVVEAIAICDDKIIYAGDKSGVDKYVVPETEIIKIPDGQIVVPGFMDGHSHIGGMSARKSSIHDISEKATNGTPDMIVEEMAEYIKANPNKPFYCGHNWADSAFENNCPTADILDKLDTDKPVFVIDNGGHSYWLNSAMLKFANITKDTPDPIGGKIERYPDGTPNGCLRDTALALVQKALPYVGPKARIPGLLEGQELYKNLGYTAVFEALTNEQNKSLQYPNIEAYEMLDKAGMLDIYTQGSFVVNNDDSALELVLTGLQQIVKTAGGKFEVKAIKIFMDGVVEGATAYLSKPYASNPDSYGSARWAGDESKANLAKIIEIANFAGVPCHVHAIGDQAISDILDAFQTVYDKIGEKEIMVRNAITHLQVVNPEDIPRFKKLGITAVINPWACKAPGFYHETESKHLGEERASKEFPYKSFLKAGVKTSFATDYGCSFVCDPVECFHALTTRTWKTDEPDTTLNPDEKLTREEALKVMTKNVAYQMDVDDLMGSIEVGKLANLDIISKDILTIPDNEIMSAEILSAMCYGKWIKGNPND